MFRVKYIKLNLHGNPTRIMGVGGEVESYILEKVKKPRPKVVESINRTVAQAADRA